MGHLSSRATLPLYSLSTNMQAPTSMQSVQTNATHTHHQFMPSNSGRFGSLRHQPDDLRRYQATANSTVVTDQACPKNCPCICHTSPPRVSSHVTGFNEDQQRPGVIMVPVSHDKTVASATKHVPLQVGYGHCVPV